MKPFAVVSRYSRAIFEIAEEKGQSGKVFLELASVAKAMADRPELLDLLDSPLITKHEKHALFEGILGSGANLVSKNFLNLLVDKNRIDLFPFIAEELQSIVRQKEGIQNATIVTARKLHESIIQLLQKTLEKVTGKKILIDSEIDPELLGGIQIRIGNRLIDGSMRSKLSALETQLRNVKVV